MTTRPSGAALVEDVLERYGTLVFGALRAYLPQSEPRRYLYDLVRQYPDRGGKAFRPSLCVAACGAYGGRVADAILTSVGLELLHNAFLIHDDIEDESQSRRGAQTLHDAHGVPLAINAGDATAMLALRPLIDNVDVLGPDLARAILQDFDDTTLNTIEGQAVELGWRLENTRGLTPENYLELVLRKTCWYTTIFPLRAGAFIGSWGQVDRDLLTPFGFCLGAVFQIADDLRNLEHDPQDGYGKEFLGDILEGKRTLMLIHLLANVGAAEADEIYEYLSRPRADRSIEDAAAIRARMADCGSITYAQEYCAGVAEEAAAEFAIAFQGLPPSEDLAFIEALVPYMLSLASSA